MFCHPIPGLDHLNVLSYIDVLRRYAHIGNRDAIIVAGRIRFDTKRWMEDWGVEGNNEARAGASATVPSQRQRGRRRKQKRGKRGRRIVLMYRKVGKLGNLGRTTGWIHRVLSILVGYII